MVLRSRVHHHLSTVSQGVGVFRSVTFRSCANMQNCHIFERYIIRYGSACLFTWIFPWWAIPQSYTPPTHIPVSYSCMAHSRKFVKKLATFLCPTLKQSCPHPHPTPSCRMACLRCRLWGWVRKHGEWCTIEGSLWGDRYVRDHWWRPSTVDGHSITPSCLAIPYHLQHHGWTLEGQTQEGQTHEGQIVIPSDGWWMMPWLRGSCTKASCCDSCWAFPNSGGFRDQFWSVPLVGKINWGYLKACSLYHSTGHGDCHL